MPKYKIIDYYREKKEKRELKRSCNKSKACYIFDVLQEQGYIRCVDYSYYSTQYDDDGGVELRGRSRRYVLTAKHPMYKEFVDAVGVGVINEWIKISQVSHDALN